MRLPGSYLREIVNHANEDKPNEVCGLIAGKDGHATKLYRTKNSDPNPRVRYNVEPLELLNALREMDRMGWGMMGIYHSHPATDAYPSGTDIGLAYYPEAVYIIVSLAGSEGPVARAFRIVDGQVIDETLEIDEDDPRSGEPESEPPENRPSVVEKLSKAAGDARGRLTASISRLRAGRGVGEQPQEGE